MIETAANGVGVTRAELVEAVERAFGDGRASRGELIGAAQEAGARTMVVELIRTLPEVTMRSPRELWAHLPDLPVR
jgi:hypothetical protein